MKLLYHCRQIIALNKSAGKIQSGTGKNENVHDILLKCFKGNQQEANLLRDKNIEQLTISITADNIARKQICGNWSTAPAVDDLKRFNPNAKPFYSGK